MARKSFGPWGLLQNSECVLWGPLLRSEWVLWRIWEEEGPQFEEWASLQHGFCFLSLGHNFVEVETHGNRQIFLKKKHPVNRPIMHVVESMCFLNTLRKCMFFRSGLTSLLDNVFYRLRDAQKKKSPGGPFLGFLGS